jgi:transcriptional regulator with XRE-family HTH domain
MRHEGYENGRRNRLGEGSLELGATGPAPAGAFDDLPGADDPPAGNAHEDGSYQQRLGARLRAIRRARGMRLQDVEIRSAGRFKAVVVGSYERGDRAISAHRLAALATFYDVPLEDILPDAGAVHRARSRTDEVPLAIDQLRLRDDPELEPLARLTHHVQWQRGDYNGRVLTLRNDDLRTLAIALGLEPEQLASWLAERGLLAST